MSKLTIEKGSLSTFTCISDVFIDEYMPQANGDFVKIYLYLLRRSSNVNDELSICKIADEFNYTENDILRAFSYWEQIGLLSLSYDPSNNLSGIRLEEYNSSTNNNKDTTIVSLPNLTSAAETPDTTIEPEQIKTKEKTTYSPRDLERFLANDDISQLLYIVQRYLGKTLSNSETNTLLYFYDELNFSVELIEYLIEYCVSKDHKSMRYIEKVALNWAEKSINTVEKAKDISSIYNNSMYSVLKAFGISGRNPGETEKAYIVKWTNSYGFNLDIIIDACNRTIHSIHQPSFEYADTILNNWKDKGVKHLSEVKALDEEYEKKKIKQVENKQTVTLQNNKNNFNSFSQRTYNYTELEKQLLSK